MGSDKLHGSRKSSVTVCAIQLYMYRDAAGALDDAALADHLFLARVVRIAV